MAQTRFKYPKWPVPVSTLAGVSAVCGGYMLRNDEWWIPASLIGFGIISLLASYEFQLSYLTLEKEHLEYRQLFKKTRISKSEIEKVTWESGSGVAIRLKNSNWEKLPTLGRNTQAMANSIRAWINKNPKKSRFESI